MRAFFFTLLIYSLTLSPFAQAEYRVYKLGVKYHPKNPNDTEHQVLTTLDHLQYETYYKITSEQQTRLIKHWMCWGRTDLHAAYCPEPLSLQKQDQSPNSAPVLRTPAQTQP